MEFLKENRKNILTYVAIMALVIIIAFIAFSGISTNVEYKNVDKVALAEESTAINYFDARRLMGNGFMTFQSGYYYSYSPYPSGGYVDYGLSGDLSSYDFNNVTFTVSSSGYYYGYSIIVPTTGTYTLSFVPTDLSTNLQGGMYVSCDVSNTYYVADSATSGLTLEYDSVTFGTPYSYTFEVTNSNAYMLSSSTPVFVTTIVFKTSRTGWTNGRYKFNLSNIQLECGDTASAYSSPLDLNATYENGFSAGYNYGNNDGLGKYDDNIYTYHYLYSMGIGGSSSWVSKSTFQDTVSFSIEVLSSQFCQYGYMYTLIDVPGPGTYIFSCDPLDESTPGTGVTSNYKIVIGDNVTLTKDNTNWVQNGEIEFTVDESHYDTNTKKYRIYVKYYITDYSNPNSTTCKWSFNNHKIVSEEYRTLTDSYYTEGRGDGIELGNEVGYQEGFADGEESGYQEGYWDGEDFGYAEGESHGYQEGYEEGVSVSYDVGYNEGYSNGKINGETSATKSWNGLLPTLFGSIASFFVILLDGITIFDTTMLTLLGTIGVFLLAYFLISKFR